MNSYVADLSTRAALSPLLSGGKGAGLAWLCRQGFRVPSGFIITTDAFRYYVESAAPGCENVVAALSALADAPLPERIERPILKAYRRLGGPVAVRSSLVGEDTFETSFAGQLTTCLDVEGEENILAAVRTCWASLCNARVSAYLKQNTIPVDALVMAVVVQRMIQPVAAGVAFSANPLTGEAQVVIEGAAGRGDVVVSGVASTDRYVVDARGDLVEAMPVYAGGLVLTDQQVRQLAGIIREIEKRAGRPQDVEWAWDGAAFHILQSRAITTLHHHHVFSRRVVGEMAPGLIKPMVYGVNVVPKGTQLFGRLFTELIGPHDVDYGKLVPLIYSRAYGDMTLMGELFTRAGLPPNFIEMMYQEERARGGGMQMNMAMLRPMSRVARFAARNARLEDRAEREISERDAALGQYRTADWSGIAPNELISLLDRLILMRNEFFWLFFLITVSMVLRTGALNRWTRRQAPDVPFSDLIRGLSGLKGLEPMAEIERLSCLAQDLSPNDLALLSNADEATIQSRLSDSEIGRKLLAHMHGFLKDYGYLSSSGSDFSVPVWNETPVIIWRAVGRSAVLPAVISCHEVERIREEALRRVRDRLSPTMCPAFNRLFASTVTYIGLRERISLLMSEYSYQMRRLFLAIAAHLVETGDLVRLDDVFHLTYDEMKGMVSRTLNSCEMQKVINERIAKMSADAAINPPDIVRGDPASLQSVPHTDIPPSACLVGIGGSTGVVRGRARVVHDPVNAPAMLNRGDILVVPYSDVGWTPLFPAVGGIVAETGGQLSHTAIVAREYGLPAVVSVKGAMRLIQDGQMLMVDGDRGRVYLDEMPA